MKGEIIIMNDVLYKTGELAKLAGVSVRTIRYYDSKGILKPIGVSDSGYRLYNIQALEKLQKIVMLKYLGFSLEQIKQIMDYDSSGINPNLRDSLQFQKKLLKEKIQHMERMLEVIEAAEKIDEKEQDRLTGSEESDIWNKLIQIIKLATEKELFDRQYGTDENLQKRINIHAYSTSTESWMHWVYERLELQKGMRILEIGCGNGLLWKENIEKLPENLYITLTDNSSGMIEKTKQYFDRKKEKLREKGIRYVFKRLDAERAEIEEEAYDVIIANHTLYHLNNRDDLLEKINRGLREQGVFYCSTLGEKHMKELNDFVRRFDSNIEIPLYDIIKNFQLENGREQLVRHFTNINMEIQDNDLLVKSPDAIYQYVYSYPGNAPEILEKKEKLFKSMVEKIIEEHGGFYIHKEQGLFRAEKNPVQ